jgi:hypothetical protein
MVNLSAGGSAIGSEGEGSEILFAIFTTINMGAVLGGDAKGLGFE